MQVAIIEIARHLANLDDAQSTEFDKKTPHPVIALITEWQESSGSIEERNEQSDLGGSMRLGAQKINLTENSLIKKIYHKDSIQERHRHRYEFNNNYRDVMTEAGIIFSGTSVDDLVEVIELSSKSWFVATQFHPEFTSNPRDGHPLFKSFVRACVTKKSEAEN